MDYEGQKLAEWLLLRMLIMFGVVGFVAGYASGSFKLMCQINAVGLVLTCLAVLPDWPWYRSHPIKWVPALNPPDAKAK